MILRAVFDKCMQDEDWRNCNSGCTRIELEGELRALIAAWQQFTSSQRKALTTIALARLPSVS
jgi:hypothetical protein